MCKIGHLRRPFKGLFHFLFICICFMQEYKHILEDNQTILI